MDIKDLAGKTVKRGLGPWDIENDRDDWCIEFTDGTKVYFFPNAYSSHTTDCEVYPPNLLFDPKSPNGGKNRSYGDKHNAGGTSAAP